ncbi:MAG: DedA family protein [Nostoc sp. RI_552]|nr:DedA family protein [Nostoc sp. RI_552]
MLEWIISIVNSLGYCGIALLMFIENLFPPIPSELIMPLAGFTARATPDKLNIFGVFFAGLLGSVAGSFIWYYPGKFLSERRLITLVDQYGHWLTISRQDITKGKQWFDKQGNKAVLIGRLVPGIRTLISVPAGMNNMHLLPFLFYTTLGSAAWVGLLTYLGYVLGSHYELVENYIAPVSKIVLASLVLIFVGWLLNRQRKRTDI